MSKDKSQPLETKAPGDSAEARQKIAKECLYRAKWFHTLYDSYANAIEKNPELLLSQDFKTELSNLRNSTLDHISVTTPIYFHWMVSGLGNDEALKPFFIMYQRLLVLGGALNHLASVFILTPDFKSQTIDQSFYQSLPPPKKGEPDSGPKGPSNGK
jgi:hypothetical protein